MFPYAISLRKSLKSPANNLSIKVQIKIFLKLQMIPYVCTLIKSKYEKPAVGIDAQHYSILLVFVTLKGVCPQEIFILK